MNCDDDFMKFMEMTTKQQKCSKMQSDNNMTMTEHKP